jgi:replicative DNA helicase
MSLDITVLRLLKYRERYERLARNVPPKALDTRTKIVLDDFGAFFREFPNATKIEPGSFMLWFKGFRHPTLKDEAAAIFTEVIKSSMDDVDPDIEAGLMERLVAADTAVRVAELLEKWTAGDEVDLYTELRANVERFEQQVDRKVKNPQVLDAIEDLLKDEENDTGLHWRLPCINRHIKPLRAGDFVVVAARPDKGKTSFAASELTHMASQVDSLYPGERRSILWFNNEGPGRRIVTRCFQAALNATTEDLVARSNAGTIRSDYATALGGRGGTLRIFDIHDMWNHEVEDLMRLHKPAAVLFDMVDNIKFGGDANNNGQRTDQLLEAMYQWARLMGVKHDCAVIATSQISADGDGLQFPTLPMLKDSKTGKQGAADVIITLGAVNDPSLLNSRYIGTTKNKKARSRMPSSPNMEVIFDGDRSRYVEVQQ